MDMTNPTNTSGIEPKQHFTGTIVKTTLAGAVVDLGLELPGVIHISQLQQESVNRVEDVVTEGQTVEVWVRRVKKDRIELTMIEPLGLEWREMTSDMVVKGKVVRLEAYGAFVDIGAERPGLVHVSELSHSYVKNPSEIIKEGDEIEAKILEVNRRKKQIRLSLKALQENPAETYSSKPSRQVEEIEDDEPVSREPELTAMQIAWQEALNKANAEAQQAKGKRGSKSETKEQEDLLKRTLKQRISTN